MLRVGLTGGIASGKSVVADMFVELGATLIDTDSIAREVVAIGQPGLDAVVESFGDCVLNARGELDRVKLRARVFLDADERHRLERILHPLIREKALAAMDMATGPYLIVAVPLLVETNFAELVDRVLVVDCPETLQVKRLMRRDGVGEGEARAMLAAQTHRDNRLASANDVIDNGGALEATRRQVAQLHRRYLALSSVC